MNSINYYRDGQDMGRYISDTVIWWIPRARESWDRFIKRNNNNYKHFGIEISESVPNELFKKNLYFSYCYGIYTHGESPRYRYYNCHIPDFVPSFKKNSDIVQDFKNNVEAIDYKNGLHSAFVETWGYRYPSGVTNNETEESFDINRS